MVLQDDGSLWIGDEYAAYVYHFSSDGELLTAIPPPEAIIPRRNGTVSFASNNPPRYDLSARVKPKHPDSGRANNQGAEGLTVSPDGKTLWMLLQSALVQEGGRNTGGRRYSRLLKYDISNASQPEYVEEYVVPLPLYNGNHYVAKQSEIHLLSDTQFLILARDSRSGRGADKTKSAYRHADIFDISKATNIKGCKYDCETCAIASIRGKLKKRIVPAEYCSFLDYNIAEELAKFGLHDGGAQDSSLLNEKWESFALAPVNPQRDSDHEGLRKREEGGEDYFLFSLSDNDFVTQHGYMNGGDLPYADGSGDSIDNQVLVFHITLPEGSKPALG